MLVCEDRLLELFISAESVPLSLIYHCRCYDCRSCIDAEARLALLMRINQASEDINTHVQQSVLQGQPPRKSVYPYQFVALLSFITDTDIDG